MRFIKTIFCFTILLSFSLLTVSGQAANATKSYGKGNPFTIEQLPPGQFKQKLKVLPEQAQKNALAWMHEHSFTASDFIDLRVDDNGGIFYEDPAPANTDAVSSNTPVLEELSLAETFSLHSKPGASRTVFIDMDGEIITFEFCADRLELGGHLTVIQPFTCLRVLLQQVGPHHGAGEICRNQPAYLT